MAQHRYRQNKIKREHTIIDGILPVLEAIAQHPHVHGITPGRINKRSSSRNATVTVQYRTEAGLKLLARTTTAVQEVFVVTDHPDQVLEDLIARRLVKAPGRKRRDQATPGAGTTASSPEAAPSHEATPSREAPSSRAVSSSREVAASRETASSREAHSSLGAASSREPSGARRPEVADAISAEVQQQLLAMARERADTPLPARQARPKKPSNVWREIERTHRELLAVEEPPGELD